MNLKSLIKQKLSESARKIHTSKARKIASRLMESVDDHDNVHLVARRAHRLAAHTLQGIPGAADAIAAHTAAHIAHGDAYMLNGHKDYQATCDHACKLSERAHSMSICHGV